MENKKIEYVSTYDDIKTPVVGGLAMKYIQDCDIDDDIQEIKISTENLGNGQYFVISTDRWAFDNIDDLINILKDFKFRM